MFYFKCCNSAPPKPVFKINGTQCSEDEFTWCPEDTCNQGFCENGCAFESCATWKGCPGEFTEFAVQEKQENQLCIIRKNNCISGLKCVDQEDGCDNGIGRCIKSGKLKYDSNSQYFMEKRKLPTIL